MNKNVKIFLIGLLVVILILGLYAINVFSGITKNVSNKFVEEIVKNDLIGKGLKKITNDISSNKIKNSQSPTKVIESTKVYTYNSSGKRDPFVRYDANANIKQDEINSESPLEQIDINKLKLTAIIYSGETPKAVIEDQNGKGFFVEKGTNIGLQNGVISEILKDKIIITETQTDFTGQKKIRNIEMTLRK